MDISTAAESARENGSPSGESGALPRARLPPNVAAGWLLRAAAFAAVAAGAMSLIVAPGVRGNAAESVVDATEHVASWFTFFLVELLLTVLLWGALELARSRGVAIVARWALVTSAGVVVALSAPGLRERLPALYSVLIAAIATVAAIAGGTVSARTPHTRALAGVLFMVAFAEVARLGAWEFGMAAGDRASVQLFRFSRGLATAGILFEASAQITAIYWLFTRSRVAGQLGSTAALVLAFVATWGVAQGMKAAPALWQAVLRTALLDAPGVPPPYWLDAVATLLVPSSLLLALAAAAQPGQVAAVTAAVAFALVSRGAFDAPLRALCAVAAAQWAALASVDQRAMWRTLIGDRKRRLAEEGQGQGDQEDQQDAEGQRNDGRNEQPDDQGADQGA